MINVQKSAMLRRSFSFKKSLKFFLGVFLLTTISLVFYYITPILFAWSGPSDLPPGGNIDLVGIVRNRFNMVEESVSGNVEIDLSEGSVFKHTLTGSVTYTGITGFSLGKLNSFKLVIEQDDENVYEITWPGNITWKNYEHPLDLELSSGGIYDFVTSDDGTTWYGSVYYDSRGGLQLGSNSGSKPSCTSSKRGMMWMEYGGVGEDDGTFVCSKNSEEGYSWVNLGLGLTTISATGGDDVYTTSINGSLYKIHKFTLSGSSFFNINYAPNGSTIEYLVVGGGGGGGGSTAGGGGGGGVLSGSISIVGGESYSVQVGAGGSGSRFADAGVPNNTNGGNSSLGSLIAFGGGSGASGRISSAKAATTGGSGGGGGHYVSNTPEVRAGVSGTSGQGHSGGSCTYTDNSSFFGGGGGGGAGGAGGNWSSATNGGVGGAGAASSITGTQVYYGGGGGGADEATGGAGGVGGGGNGVSGGGDGQNGVANTGGGGGGSPFYQSGNGGNGGSGIVIIRYKI